MQLKWITKVGLLHFLFYFFLSQKKKILSTSGEFHLQQSKSCMKGMIQVILSSEESLQHMDLISMRCLWKLGWCSYTEDYALQSACLGHWSSLLCWTDFELLFSPRKFASHIVKVSPTIKQTVCQSLHVTPHNWVLRSCLYMCYLALNFGLTY